MQSFDVRKWMAVFFAHLHPDGMYYIGGADPLPQPLNPE